MGCTWGNGCIGKWPIDGARATVQRYGLPCTPEELLAQSHVLVEESRGDGWVGCMGNGEGSEAAWEALNATVQRYGLPCSVCSADELLGVARAEPRAGGREVEPGQAPPRSPPSDAAPAGVRHPHGRSFQLAPTQRWTDMLQVLVGGDEVEHGKPRPDIAPISSPLTPLFPHAHPSFLTHTPLSSRTPLFPHSHPSFLTHTPLSSRTPLFPHSHPSFLTHTPLSSLTPLFPHSHPSFLTHTPLSSLTPFASPTLSLVLDHALYAFPLLPLPPSLVLLAVSPNSPHTNLLTLCRVGLAGEGLSAGVEAAVAAGMWALAVPSLPNKAARPLYSAAHQLLPSLLDFQPQHWGLPSFSDWQHRSLPIPPWYIKGAGCTALSPSLPGLHRSLPIPPWYIKGPVIKGFGRGSKVLGIPTANLPASSFTGHLAEHVCGIYHGWAGLKGRGVFKMVMMGVFKMVMSVGWNRFINITNKTEPCLLHDGGQCVTAPIYLLSPAAHSHEPCLLHDGGQCVTAPIYLLSPAAHSQEPWLLHDFGEDFYDEELRLVVVGYIRPEADFPSLPALIARIHEDGAIARTALDSPPFASFKEDPFLAEG
ncbi:unnamed protein product [Closterium sp. NIES-65]|nr:unnamed protein product [Closterium sp. NIES-65]